MIDHFFISCPLRNFSRDFIASEILKFPVKARPANIHLFKVNNRNVGEMCVTLNKKTLAGPKYTITSFESNMIFMLQKTVSENGQIQKQC